jgi:hypothetical protein
MPNTEAGSNLDRSRGSAARHALAAFLIGIVTLVAPAGAAEPVTPHPASPSGHAYTNRLIDSANPYLLLHAHNPVDWYPWGPEAFEKAKKENKLIFLSVGWNRPGSQNLRLHLRKKSQIAQQLRRSAGLLTDWRGKFRIEAFAAKFQPTL